MQMMFRIIIVVSVLLLITFCKKREDKSTIDVSGTVINELTKEPVGGVTISLAESCGSGGTGSASGWSIINSVTTDVKGQYNFHEEVSDCGGWKVDVNASPNYDSRFSIAWFKVNPNEKVQVTTEIY